MLIPCTLLEQRKKSIILNTFTTLKTIFICTFKLAWLKPTERFIYLGSNRV